MTFNRNSGQLMMFCLRKCDIMMIYCLVDIANDRGERIEELEDIIERAQSEVEDLQMHISFDWDNWTLMMDANNIMDVLNEY